MKLAIIFFVGFTILSCAEDETDNHISEELQIYIERFVQEADANEVIIDLGEFDLDASIRDIETSGTIGQCISFSDGSNEIVLDETHWDRMSEMDKEYAVFHELGHCLLARSHNDSRDSRGQCTSIMQSGQSSCRKVYNSSNRSDLLEELFSD